MHALPVRQLPGRATGVLLLVALVATLVQALSSAASSSQGSSWGRVSHLDPGLTTLGSGLSSVLVTATGGVEAAADAVRATGGSVRAPLPLVDGVAASVPATRLGELSLTPGVLAVTKDRDAGFTAAPADPSSTGTAQGDAAPSAGASTSTFAAASQVGAAWSKGNQGQGVGIAVLDTGVSAVPDFAGRLVQGPDLSGEDSPVDTHGHGTVMAGVAAGSGAASAGRHTGVAPQATVVSVKVAGRDGAVDVSTILQAMHWVSSYREQYGIRVLSLSWGTPSTQDPAVDPLNHAVQRLWQQGIVVVVAAGNSGPHAGTVTKPADDPMVLTVGAYDDKGDSSAGNDTLTSWSSRGPTAAGIAKPDVVAPGRTLVAARSIGSEIEAANPSGLVGDGYIKGSGTSQAAAVVSGLAALVLAEHPTWTPDQVKRVLTDTASPLTSAGRASQGAGRVQLAAALQADPGPAHWQVPTATGVGSLELSRGGSTVEVVCPGAVEATPLVGELDARCQPWSGSRWSGSRWSDEAWTGSRWSEEAWAGSRWSGTDWTGSRWSDSTWSGSRWSGSRWSGEAWAGSRWSGSRWSGSRWSGSRWSSLSPVTKGDDFLTAFWGQEAGEGRTLQENGSHSP